MMRPFVIFAVDLTRTETQVLPDGQGVVVTVDAKPRFFVLAENPSEVVAQVTEILDLDGRPITCEAEMGRQSAWMVSCCERHDYCIEVKQAGMGVTLSP